MHEEIEIGSMDAWRNSDWKYGCMEEWKLEVWMHGGIEIGSMDAWRNRDCR